MAVTVTSNLSLIDTADTETGWTGNSGEQDLEVYLQGGATPASYTWQTNKNSIKTASFTHATGVDASGYSYPHIYFWMRDDVFPFTEDKTTGTVNNSGLMLEITLSNNATKMWHIAGADTWRGEWKNFMLDLSNASDLFSSSGTWDLSANTIDKVEWQTDNSNSGTIRIIDNTWQDVLRVGEGLSATGTSFNLSDISTVDSTLLNMYGVLQKNNGVLFSQGKLTIGSGATTTTFSSVGEQMTFIDPSTSGLGGGSVGSLNSNLYSLKIQGSGTDFSLKGGVISGVNNAYFSFDFSDSTINSIDIIGNTIAQASTVQCQANATTCSVTGNTFASCGYIDVADCTFENNTINSTTETTYGSIWVTSDTDLDHSKNINFNSFGSNYAIYVDASVTSFDMDNFQFDNPNGVSSNYALYWAAAAGTLTITGTNGTNLTSAGCTSAGGTVTVATSASFILTGLEDNSEVRIYNSDLSSELYGIENTSGGTTTFNYNTTYTDAVVQVHHIQYETIRFTVQLDGNNASIPIQQQYDRTYSNP